MNSQTRVPVIDIGDRMDRLPLTGLHLLIVLACAVGFCFDLADIAFGNIISAVFSAPPYRVDSALLSWLLAAVYVGAIVGAPLGGMLADRYGRRATMLALLALLAVTSFAAGASQGMLPLILARGLSGLALGAYPPLMTAMLADTLPPARRGPMLMAAIAIGYLGPPALIFAVRALTPIVPLGVEGWRWAFVIGGIGALLCMILFWLAPESPRWLSGAGRLDEAERNLAALRRAPVVAAARPPAGLIREARPVLGRHDYFRRTGLLMLIYFLTPWATVGFALLSGAVLVAKGFAVQQSLLYIGIANFGPVVGTIIGAFFIDRVDRRFALATAAIGMAVFGLAFGATGSPLWLTTTGLVFNLLTSLFLPVLVLYAAELFPTSLRAGATSLAWASNRVGSAIVPLALLPLLHISGPMSIFLVIGATLVAFTVLVLGPAPRGPAGEPIG